MHLENGYKGSICAFGPNRTNQHALEAGLEEALKGSLSGA
jgi:hypothetical protein